MNATRIQLPQWLVVAIGALLLLLPACYNHYPMVDPDAGTYIASGFKLDTPMDRPITYGLLVRLFSLNGVSLWGVIIMQSILLSWLLLGVAKLALSRLYTPVSGLFIMLFLSQFTALPWLAGMVHPDIFTAVAFLLLILILGGDKPRWWLYGLLWLAVAVHMSHPLLMAAMVIMLFATRKLYAHKLFPVPGSRYIVAGVLSLSAIAIMGSAISKSKHVFFTGTLVEKGVLQVYLNEQCETKSYRLCAYKDNLPKTSDAFIWLRDSPLYQVGDWAGSKDEFSRIDGDVMTTPRYLWLYTQASASQFVRQLNTFNVGTGTFRFAPGSNVHQQIQTYLPHELSRFEHAMQNQADLPGGLAWVNILLKAIVYASVLALAWFIISGWRSMFIGLKLVVIVVIGGYIVNCADFAALSTLVGRYSAKVVWLLPFAAVLCFLSRVVPKLRQPR